MGNPAGARRDFDALEKRRFEAVRLLDKGINQSEIAHRLQVARQTVSRWAGQVRSAEGKLALKKAGRAGRKPRLNDENRKRLEALLVRGPEALGYETPLWTCPRVAHLIEQEFGIKYHEGHVWKVLISMGWSPQRPVGRARERNEAEIRRWRKTVWPVNKKKRVQKGARSSSSMKAD